MRKLVSIVFVLVSIYAHSQSICGGSSATLQAPNPQNLVGPTFSLQPGGFSSIGGTFVVTPSATATYTLYTTGTNTNNAIVTTSAVTIVTVNAQPNSVPTTTQSTCTSSINALNLNLTFNPSTPAPTYTIAWSSIPNGMTSAQQTSITGAVSPGPYTATITAAGGCSLIVNFTMDPQPAPAIFSVNPFGGTHSITCITPTLDLVATNPNLTYTWTSTSFSPIVSNSVSLTQFSLGTIGVTGQNTVSGCTTTYTFAIVQNTLTPSVSTSTNFISINCTLTNVPTLTISASPSVNVTNCIYAPNATGTFCAASYTTIYQPGIPGTYTYCAINNENGCSTCSNFTVASSDSYPTYSVVSLQNFTLGCTSKSVASVAITSAQATGTNAGGAVSYTLLPPGFTGGYGTGTVSTYSVNVPGSYTVVVQDNANGCQSKSMISIIQNTFTPGISALVPRQILDCGYTTTILMGLSETPNVSYDWGFQGTPGHVAGSTITVIINAANPTQTLINTYTLTVKDMGNTCTSTSIIPMNQNTFPPKTLITNGGVNALTCLTKTIVLTNFSSTGILPATGYPTNQPVIGYLWTGPTPQEPLQLSTTYIAQVFGTYTLQSKDMNNSCVSTGTIEILDNQKYPIIYPPTPSVTTIDCGSNSAIISPTYNPTSGLSYSWTGVTGGTVSTKNSPTYVVSLPGNYTVSAQNIANGCATTTIFPVVTGILTAKFVTSVDSGFAPLPVMFTNNSQSSTGSGSITSIWNYSNGDTSITKSVTISPETIYTQPGNYKITMYSVKGSCRDTAYRTIKVFSSSSFTVPNIFTPNGDHVNDLFFLRATNLTEITFVIYDRWGHLTYELTSYTGNIEWDGKNQYGKESAEGVYYYYMKAKGSDGETYDQSGTINLVR